MLPKSVAVLLLAVASAPSVVKAPIAVEVPVPPFTIDTTSLITKINRKINLSDSTTVFVTP